MMSPNRLAVELGRRKDGPHADEHTAGAAALAAEAIRFLNYATGNHVDAGLTFPATVYDAIADLKLAAGRLPQLLGQIERWLREQVATGMLGTDDGTDPAEPIATACGHLVSASVLADVLSTDLSAAQNALSAVNGRGPNRQAGGAR